MKNAAWSLLVSFVVLAAACDRRSHADDADHGHAHGEAPADEPPTLDVTSYESGLELFMEYPSFVVGTESPLVAHFSDTKNPDGFVAIAQGRVTATLTYEGGREERFVADAPQRLGVFKPVVKPSATGKATLALLLEGAQAQGVVHVGEVVVYADVKAAQTASEEEPPGEKSFPYFKEAMWKTTYATTLAQRRVLRGGIAANGEIQPVAGQEAALSAPAAGRIDVRSSVGGAVHIGRRVKRGESLFTLVPLSSAQGDRASVELEFAAATAERGLKERDLARSRELVAAGAQSPRQADAAAVDLAVATARVDAAQKRLAQLDANAGTSGGAAAIELRSPIDGVVAFADVVPGAVVQAGQRLASIVNPARVWLNVAVPEVDIARASESVAASFVVRGFDKPFPVAAPDGKRVAVGAAVDPLSRTVPVVFELANPGGALKPGMFAAVVLLTGETVEGVAVPEEAVLDDDGKSVVYVMKNGESFFLRRVKTGVREGGWVQILDGVKDGERVVSRGAFEIKLANAGGIPAHGHQH